MSGGYSQVRSTQERYASHLEGQAAMYDGIRRRRAHAATCPGCDICDAAAEARKEREDS